MLTMKQSYHHQVNKRTQTPQPFHAQKSNVDKQWNIQIAERNNYDGNKQKKKNKIQINKSIQMFNGLIISDIRSFYKFNSYSNFDSLINLW